MVWYLIKKDFVIVKKYVLLMLAVVVLIPVFMLWRLPGYAGQFSFAISAVFSVFMLLNQVFLAEFNAPKASSLLLSSPYSRTAFVLSKYGFYLVVFAACCLIFWLETLFLPSLGTFQAELPSFTFFALSLIFGLYLPVQYRYGYAQTKVAFVLIIMASPILLSYFVQSKPSFPLPTFPDISPACLCVLSVSLGLLILAVSAAVSVRIYQKADLA